MNKKSLALSRLTRDDSVKWLMIFYYFSLIVQMGKT